MNTGRNTKENGIKGTVIINDIDRRKTPDEVARGIFGISVKQLIKDIQINKDGRYDSLYADN